MKNIDMPPLWLLLFAVLAWVQADAWPVLQVTGAFGDFLGGLLVGAGLVLMALAFVEFRKHSTTVIPHREASTLITTGIYTRSRNPIYVADALILTGLILRWDAIPSLILVPMFMWVIQDRFIEPEEARLKAAFPEQFANYASRVRRWV